MGIREMANVTTTEVSRARSAAEVPADLVQAALRAADKLGRQVADVSVSTIAREAGISRSTLLRRIGGSRVPLDDAVRAAGVEPGGQPGQGRPLVAPPEFNH